MTGETYLGELLHEYVVKFMNYCSSLLKPNELISVFLPFRVLDSSIALA